MYTQKDLIEMVDLFRTRNSTENEWLEFKSNHISDQDIGKYVSALSNGAALMGRPFGYLIFGVEDSSHEVIERDLIIKKQSTAMKICRTGLQDLFHLIWDLLSTPLSILLLRIS